MSDSGDFLTQRNQVFEKWQCDICTCISSILRELLKSLESITDDFGFSLHISMSGYHICMPFNISIHIPYQKKNINMDLLSPSVIWNAGIPNTIINVPRSLHASFKVA